MNEALVGVLAGGLLAAIPTLAGVWISGRFARKNLELEMDRADRRESQSDVRGVLDSALESAIKSRESFLVTSQIDRSSRPDEYEAAHTVLTREFFAYISHAGKVRSRTGTWSEVSNLVTESVDLLQVAILEMGSGPLSRERRQEFGDRLVDCQLKIEMACRPYFEGKVIKYDEIEAYLEHRERNLL